MQHLPSNSTHLSNSTSGLQTIPQNFAFFGERGDKGETEFHVALAGFNSLLQRMLLSLWASRLSLPSAEITSMCHYKELENFLITKNVIDELISPAESNYCQILLSLFLSTFLQTDSLSSYTFVLPSQNPQLLFGRALWEIIVMETVSLSIVRWRHWLKHFCQCPEQQPKPIRYILVADPRNTDDPRWIRRNETFIPITKWGQRTQKCDPGSATYPLSKLTFIFGQGLVPRTCTSSTQESDSGRAY